MSCHFHIEIYAPKGLSGIEASLARCTFTLQPHTSGYNGKVVLRCPDDDEVEWAMDSSDDDIMVATGCFFTSVDSAEAKVRSLSACLAEAGFPHRIHLDDAQGNLYAEFEHAWSFVPGTSTKP